MKLREIQVSDSLEGLARVGISFLKGVVNASPSPALGERLDGLVEELRHTVKDRRLSELEVVQLARKLYHRLGLDPTKDRPSSERLLRRVQQGRPLPRINTLVDAVNLASLSLQCPLGVYDWDKVAPPVLVRIGRPDEGYLSVSRNPLHLEGRLVLVDGEGLFGNPSQDSLRTCVTGGTVRAMVVAWAPVDATNEYLDSVLREIDQVCSEFCSGTVVESGVFP